MELKVQEIFLQAARAHKETIRAQNADHHHTDKPRPSFPWFLGIPCFFFPCGDVLVFLSVFLFLLEGQGKPADFCRSTPYQELSSDPNPQYFLKSIAVRMGGVLPYKWEVYCWASLCSRLGSQEGTAIQMGGVLPYKFTNGKKHPKKICIKNFGGTLAGGSRRGLRRPNSLCRCWFSQQNTVHKEFRGGGVLRGSWGWGLRSNFGAPFLYVYVLFWGLTNWRCITALSPRSGRGWGF